jgi:hypothetical protein
MRKSRRDFHKEVIREPYELELENSADEGPAFVTFLDPNSLESESAFALNAMTDPETIFRLLLSEKDYDAWWAEWRGVPVRETNALLEDVQKYYGADPGKPRR